MKAQIGSIGGFNTINLSQKNDLVLSYGKSFRKNESNLRIYDVQAAYAFKKYLAVHAGYHSFSTFDWDSCTDEKCRNAYDNRLLNIGLSGFVRHDLNKTFLLKNQKRHYQSANKTHLLFEAYLSYGKSKNVRNYSSTGSAPNITLKFDSYQMQTNFSYQGNFSGFSFSAMYGIIDFNKISQFGNIGNASSYVENLFRTLEEKAIYAIYGVHFKAWVGTKQVKLLYSINRKTFFDKRSQFSNINDHFLGVYYRQLTIQINLKNLKIKKKT